MYCDICSTYYAEVMHLRYLSNSEYPERYDNVLTVIIMSTIIKFFCGVAVLCRSHTLEIM